jgi:hypothetical protein
MPAFAQVSVLRQIWPLSAVVECAAASSPYRDAPRRPTLQCTALSCGGYRGAYRFLCNRKLGLHKSLHLKIDGKYNMNILGKVLLV